MLAFPTAYFAYEYIRLACYYDHPELKAYSSVIPTHSSTNSQALTNLEVNKLLESEEYKEYRRQVDQKRGEIQGTGEFRDAEEELSPEEIMREGRIE